MSLSGEFDGHSKKSHERSQNINGPESHPVTLFDDFRSSNSSHPPDKKALAPHSREDEDWEEISGDDSGESNSDWSLVTNSQSTGIHLSDNVQAPSRSGPSASTPTSPLIINLVGSSSSPTSTATGNFRNIILTNQNGILQVFGASPCNNGLFGCKSQIQELEKEIEKLLAEIEKLPELQKFRDEMPGMFLAQVEESDKWQGRVEVLEKDVKQLNETFECEKMELQKESSKLRKQYENEQRNRWAASVTALDHINHIQKLELNLIQRDTRIQRLEAELEREKWRKHVAQRQVASYQEELEERTGVDPQEIVSMHAIIDDYEIKESRHQAQLQEHQNTIQSLEKKVVDLTKQIQEPGKPGNGSSAAALRTVLRDQDRHLSNLKQEKDDVKAAIYILGTHREESKRLIDILQQKMIAPCKECQKLKGKVKHLEEGDRERDATA
jgi:DNA repair exonuclease SbcCD ATPase subunit